MNRIEARDKIFRAIESMHHLSDKIAEGFTGNDDMIDNVYLSNKIQNLMNVCNNIKRQLIDDSSNRR